MIVPLLWNISSFLSSKSSSVTSHTFLLFWVRNHPVSPHTRFFQHLKWLQRKTFSKFHEKVFAKKKCNLNSDKMFHLNHFPVAKGSFTSKRNLTLWTRSTLVHAKLLHCRSTDWSQVPVVTPHPVLSHPRPRDIQRGSGDIAPQFALLIFNTSGINTVADWSPLRPADGRLSPHFQSFRSMWVSSLWSQSKWQTPPCREPWDKVVGWCQRVVGLVWKSQWSMHGGWPVGQNGFQPTGWVGSIKTFDVLVSNLTWHPIESIKTTGPVCSWSHVKILLPRHLCEKPNSVPCSLPSHSGTREEGAERWVPLQLTRALLLVQYFRDKEEVVSLRSRVVAGSTVAVCSSLGFVSQDHHHFCGPASRPRTTLPATRSISYRVPLDALRQADLAASSLHKPGVKGRHFRDSSPLAVTLLSSDFVSTPDQPSEKSRIWIASLSRRLTTKDRFCDHVPRKVVFRFESHPISIPIARLSPWAMTTICIYDLLCSGIFR